MKKILFFLLLLIPGCVTSTQFQMVKADINMIKKEAYDARKETSDIKTSLAELKERATGTVKEDSFNAIRESGASLRSEVSGVSKDLQTLTGRFDEYKYSVDKKLKERDSEGELLRSQISALEMQLKELQQKLPPAESKTKAKTDVKKTEAGESKPAETKTPESKTPEIREPAKLYETAYNLFKDKKYKEAREKFESFVKEFPKDKLAGNAQFWIGESYYAEEDYAGAIVEYDALLKNHPDSDKAPGALLKQGYSFIAMGDKKAAKGILEQLREKYPKSREAELGKKKLEESGKKSK